MDRAYSLPLALLLFVSSLAYAHSPAGTPANYCEDSSEWDTHDYGPPAAGEFIALGQDGNLAGDCNGDTVPADYDGHIEFALGGGWLSVTSGDGVTTGSIACVGEVGHHPEFGPITVEDELLADTLSFSVTADTVNLIPPTNPSAPNCGDFQADQATDCISPCQVTFPPGLDGQYAVHTGHGRTGSLGTWGHIRTHWLVGSNSCGSSKVDLLNGLVGATLTVTLGKGRTLTSLTHSNPTTTNELEVIHSPSQHKWLIGGPAGIHGWKIETVCNGPYSGANERYEGIIIFVSLD